MATIAKHADVLLSRLEGVQRNGEGWRARCPACGGKSRKVAICESESRVLLHCFGGCAPDEVLSAAGLTWADVQPPKTWPSTPEELRKARRAIREASWGAALETLAVEAHVIAQAARLALLRAPVTAADAERIAQAYERISGAAAVLTQAAAWRPKRQMQKDAAA
jgi:hypothetical protein